MVEPNLDFWIKEFKEGFMKYEGIHLVDTDCSEVLFLLKQLKEKRETSEKKGKEKLK